MMTFGAYTVSYEPDEECPELPWLVSLDGEPLDGFASEADAVRWASDAARYDQIARLLGRD